VAGHFPDGSCAGIASGSLKVFMPCRPCMPRELIVRQLILEYAVRDAGPEPRACGQRSHERLDRLGVLEFAHLFHLATRKRIRVV
jgi:hypothetical protein